MLSDYSNSALLFYKNIHLIHFCDGSTLIVVCGCVIKVPAVLGVSRGPFAGWGRGTHTLCPLVWGGIPVHRPCAGSCLAPPLCWSLPQRWAVGSHSERYLQNGKGQQSGWCQRGVSASYVSGALRRNLKRYKHLHRYEYMKKGNHYLIESKVKL